MAWTDFDARVNAVDRVRNIRHMLQQVRTIALVLRDAKALYAAGTDPTFNAVFNQLINTPGDRTEAGGMIDQLTALCVTDWEANHPELLGLTP